MQNGTKRVNVRKLVMSAMLSAVATVLMFLGFSVPLMPSYLKLEFSELPALIASFSMVPVSGVVVCLVKGAVYGVVLYPVVAAVKKVVHR